MSRPNCRPPAGSESRVHAELRHSECGRSSGRNADVVDRLKVLRAQHRQPVLREIRGLAVRSR